MDIVLIGAGNVATVLGRKCFSAGHRIVQVYNRRGDKGRLLAAELRAEFTDQKTTIQRSADLYMIAITDDSMLPFVSDLTVDAGVVLHTAGSVSLKVLSPVSANAGVCYPLQTLRSDLPIPASIPFLIDATTPAVLSVIRTFCESLGFPSFEADDEVRRRYHLAAVLTNNFSNHLFALAEEYCQKEQIDFRQLLPLLSESVNRLRYGSARDAQTGPAIRGDQATIQHHLEMLDSYPDTQALYQTISRSIAEMYR